MDLLKRRPAGIRLVCVNERKDGYMTGKIADAAVRASHADNEEWEKWRDCRLAGERRVEVVILCLDLRGKHIPLARM